MGDILINVFCLVMAFSIFNFIRYMLKIKKLINQYKDDPTVKGISIVNGEVKIIQDKDIAPVAAVPKEVVIDPVCGAELEKKDAYRVLRNGEEFFFCSWECRQKFLETYHNTCS
jgi:YHS domain-containing protein